MKESVFSVRAKMNSDMIDLYIGDFCIATGEKKNFDTGLWEMLEDYLDGFITREKLIERTKD